MFDASLAQYIAWIDGIRWRVRVLKNPPVPLGLETGRTTCLVPFPIHRDQDTSEWSANLLSTWAPRKNSHISWAWRCRWIHFPLLSGATSLGESGVSLQQLEIAGGWKSDHVAEKYIANSKRMKREIANSIPVGKEASASALSSSTTTTFNVPFPSPTSSGSQQGQGPLMTNLTLFSNSPLSGNVVVNNYMYMPNQQQQQQHNSNQQNNSNDSNDEWSSRWLLMIFFHFFSLF